MKTNNRYVKYFIIVLVVIFLIAAAFLALDLWESGRGKYQGPATDDSVISHDGKEFVPNENIETLLVLGLDKYHGADGAASHEDGVQSDFLMLFVFDNSKEQCTAIQINRDTMTRIKKLSIGGTAVVGTYTAQIALAYNYVADDNAKIKCRNTCDSVEYLMNGIKVDHYLSLTMDCVSALNDLVGGVEVTVLDDFTGIDDALVKGETVTLTGERALRYVRSRYGLDDSTNSSRMERQQQYINALYDKTVSCMGSNESFAVELADTLDDYVVYDSSNERMMKFIEKLDKYEFLGIRDLEGESRLGEEFVEFYPDESSLRELVLDLFYKQK
ncbi:MAG: LCP family protein [Clostridia bacterium]|nr:LCP family protein [Clostridia bacterium]